jgi:hypothetical protein
VSPITSDFRLIVPLVLRALGSERIVELLESERQEFGLGEQSDLWREATRYIVGWAEKELVEYKARKS